MSRTDKTDPLIVRLWHGDLTREACHDHRAESTCDLPASEPRRVSWRPG